MPDKATMLLTLYSEAVGMNERDFHFVKRLLVTAFHEGRLDRLQEELNLKIDEDGKTNTLQHLC